MNKFQFYLGDRLASSRLLLSTILVLQPCFTHLQLYLEFTMWLAVETFI